jgi:4-hydroxybutyryl-CoA dehydratase/vinylacetyl-CoA-Delta-isomerase
MMTGDEYRESLRDGRMSFLDGELIDDHATHPLLRAAVDGAAASYDRHFSDDAGARNPLYDIPKTAEDLEKRAELYHHLDMSAHVTGTALMALITVAPELGKVNPKYHERIQNFYNYCRDNDLRCAEVVTDAKGHRKQRPIEQDDPDQYVHVVSRSDEGIVIRGAKLHISAAPLVHEQVIIPTKGMRPGEEAYALCCSVPTNAPGVTIINTTYAPHGDDLRHFPVSGQSNTPEGFVVFDDVFVPAERVFLDGEVEYASSVARALGLWERVGSIMAGDGADRLVGTAQLFAEANGIAERKDVQTKLANLAIYATIVRSAWHAAQANSEVNADGALVPSPLYISAFRYFQANMRQEIQDLIHEIAGSLTVNAPTMADFEQPELQDGLRAALETPGFSAEDRLRMNHHLRDTTADAYGGWGDITSSLAGGGMAAQQVTVLGLYDMDRARTMARESMGLDSERDVHTAASSTTD